MQLRHLPLPLLAMPMGLGGLGLTWREAARHHGASALVGEAVMVLAVLAWGLLIGLHLLRALRHPEAVAEDWRHPVRASFFAAGTIGAMEVAAAFIPWAPGLARWLLLLAIAAHVGVALALLARCIRGRGHVDMLAPPLLMPLVGHLVAAMFCAPLGLHMLGWMLLGVGGLLWLLVMPLLLWRLIARPDLPPALRPSLAIFLAPPTVGTLAVASLAGVGPWVLALFGLSSFLLALLVLGLPYMLAAGFTPALWSFTFPLANFAAVMALVAPGWPAWAALLVVTGVIGVILALTLRAAWDGRLLAPP
ncbi:TDT family transporter [Roseococcus microcysteis]|uniref:SLAC1 family transporter n=1 Tax=Roseococcus microcysteis TaxID=2771361 RepID=UPI00168AD75C|nr:hypothetical protein [Roseococcus microcysteis]